MTDSQLLVKPPLRIQRYIKKIAEMKVAESIWLGGSRSPKSAKNPTTRSDWDLQLVKATVSKNELPSLDGLKDLDIRTFDEPPKRSVQLWPKDECGLLHL